MQERCHLGPHIPHGSARFKSQLCSQLQLPANVRPGGQQVTAQVLGTRSPTRKPWIESLAPGFGLVQLQLLGIWGPEQQIDLCPYVSVSLHLK